MRGTGAPDESGIPGSSLEAEGFAPCVVSDSALHLSCSIWKNGRTVCDFWGAARMVVCGRSGEDR